MTTSSDQKSVNIVCSRSPRDRKKNKKIWMAGGQGMVLYRPRNFTPRGQVQSRGPKGSFFGAKSAFSHYSEGFISTCTLNAHTLHTHSCHTAVTQQSHSSHTAVIQQSYTLGDFAIAAASQQVCYDSISPVIC